MNFCLLKLALTLISKSGSEGLKFILQIYLISVNFINTQLNFPIHFKVFEASMPFGLFICQNYIKFKEINL